MQGHNYFTDKASPQFRLSEPVPRYNLYHRLRELLDWDFLYQETQPLYGPTGRPSLDPVVFSKLLLVGRLENTISDRRLVSQCALRLDILYFLGYEVDEDLPWHSTISRTRQRYPSSVFEQLFDWVFAQCVAQGLVAGERQAVDSAPVKANASLDSLQEKRPPGEEAPGGQVVGKPVEALSPASVRSAPAHQLRREAARQAKRQQTPDHLGPRPGPTGEQQNALQPHQPGGPHLG